MDTQLKDLSAPSPLTNHIPPNFASRRLHVDAVAQTDVSEEESLKDKLEAYEVRDARYRCSFFLTKKKSVA